MNEYLIRNSKEIIYRKNKKVLTKTPLKMKTNLTMKKISLFLLGLMAVVFITSCNKTEEATPQQGTTELSFNIQAGQAPGGLKDAPTCINENKSASYVEVTLQKQGESQTTMKTLNVFYIDGKPYTNSIKLASGTYSIKEFIMKNDNMTPNNLSDDPIVAAAVHADADYHDLVTTPLDQTIIISDFKKNVMNLELVCYDAASYTSFGFEYFKLEQTAIREQYFFGDFCIKSIADYSIIGSPYLEQSNGVQLDMPALCKIEVWQKNGSNAYSLKNTYDNLAWHGEGQPLKVIYSDNLAQVDSFMFKLYIKVRTGSVIDYIHFYDWKFKDDQKILSGDDGVVDFALGNCVPDADLVIPPWMNLPNSVTYTITAYPCPVINGDQGYVGATLSGIGNGIYDISNGEYASNCADHHTTITVGASYTMDVFSSLYPNKLPSWVQPSRWAKINWLYNHLDYFPGYQWYHIQGAIWRYDSPQWDWTAENGMPALTQSDKDMIANMTGKMNDYGTNYLVPSGGWAAILFIKNPAGNSPTIQTMIVKVDP